MGRVMTGLLLLCCMVLFFPYAGDCQTQKNSPEKLVRDFYTWYMPAWQKSMPGKKPLFDEKMKRYVYVCMLNKQRFLYSRGRYYSEYFTQSSDSYEGWEKDLVVHKSIKIEKGRYIVPITYWKGSAQLIVFVSEENGSLYITKVADPLSPF